MDTRATHEDGRGARWRFATGVAALLLSVAWAYRHDAPLRAGVDHQHVASVRELARGEFPPRHNLIGGHAPQGHYGPYFVALGFLARVTGAPPRTVLYAAGLAGALAFALALAAVARAAAGPEAASWSPWCAALLWGPWPARAMRWTAWGWPGTTSPADAQNFYYPQHAALVLLLIIVALLLPEVDARTFRWRLGLAVVLGALLVATHPLTGMALAVATASIAGAAWLEGRRRLASTAGLVLLPLVALGLAALWPYYPVTGLLRAFVDPNFRSASALVAPAVSAAAAASGAAAAPAPPPTPLFSLLGPAVVGLAGTVLLARRRRYFVLAWTLAALFAAFCPLLPLRQRLVTFVAVPLHLGAAALPGLTRDRRARVVLVAALCAGGASAALRVRWVLGQERPDLSFLPPLVPEDAIVLSDPRTSNAVAGLTGRKVVAPEGPDVFLILAGGYQRTLDADRFLLPTTSEAERRSILDRWHVTHVLVDRLAGGPALGYHVLYEGGGFALYDVRGR